MRLLSLLAAPALLSVAMPAMADSDEAVHKKCLEARDYKGCVESFSVSTQKSVKDETAQSIKDVALKSAAKRGGCGYDSFST